jgi:hypothetical protein
MNRIRKRNMHQILNIGNRPRSTSMTNTAEQRLWDQLHSKLWWLNWCHSRLVFRVRLAGSENQGMRRIR